MKINKVFLVSVIGIYILLFLVVSKNINTPYLSFDEAGQFWISKGLSHDSDPLQQPKGLAEVIENNKYFNLDPGGFGVLLHFWTGIANNYMWLRILPFMFFIGLILAFIYLSYLWLNNLNIALMMGFIPFFTPMLLNMGFEIRAYSMECLGTVMCVIALEKLKDRMTYKNLFLWGAVFSIFMTSRYFEIIVVFVASIYILFLITRSAVSPGKKLLSILAYGLPLLVTLSLIYFSALVFQNRDVQKIYYLPYLSDGLKTMLDVENIIFLGLLGLCTFLYFLKNRFPILQRYETVLFVAIGVNVLCILLSLLGKHPWAPYSNRCISIYLLVLLCIMAFLGEVLKLFLKKPVILKYYILSAVLVFAVYLRRSALRPRIKSTDTYANFKKIDISKFDQIYVDGWNAPYVRYLFEYGKLSNEREGKYPGKFTFGKYGTHKGFQNLKEDIQGNLNFDLLIVSAWYTKINEDKYSPIEGTINFFNKK